MLTPSKINILLCAAKVANQHGAGHLTLERVAETAGLSKGGLLYHYPNKRALLEGMLEYVLAQYQARISRHQQRLQDQPRPIAESFVLAESEQDDAERAMSQALLAAAAEDPKLLESARAVTQNWFAAVAAESALSQILLLATEGLRFMSMLNLLPDEPRTRAELYQTLLNAARSESQ